MLNEDKIRLMTKITMFEKKEHKRLLSSNRYFKSDYISKYLIHSFFGYTLSAALVLVVWILYHIEYLLKTITIDGIIEIGRKSVSYYLIGLGVYLVITFIVAFRKYQIAQKVMKQYIGKLKHLEKRYEFQNRAKELTKGGRHHEGSSRV